jgi:hypothetical protein
MSKKSAETSSKTYGKKAPAFTLPDQDGKTHNLAGRHVRLNIRTRISHQGID